MDWLCSCLSKVDERTAIQAFKKIESIKVIREVMNYV